MSRSYQVQAGNDKNRSEDSAEQVDGNEREVDTLCHVKRRVLTESEKRTECQILGTLDSAIGPLLSHVTPNV